MGISIAGFDLTSQENLLILANLVLIIIAVFLLIRLRIANKKNEPEKEKKTELAGIADIKPGDFKLDRLDLNKEILQQEKPGIIEDTEELPENPDTISINGRYVTPERNELELEDDAPEETNVTAEPITLIEETSEILEIEANELENPPAASEMEPNATNPGNTEKPEKKAAKKKKPGRKKKASALAGTPAKEEKPKKKISTRESLF